MTLVMRTANLGSAPVAISSSLLAYVCFAEKIAAPPGCIAAPSKARPADKMLAHLSRTEEEKSLR